MTEQPFYPQNVEYSRDRVWGIELGAASERAAEPGQWRDPNLLGFALMEARSRLAALN